MGLQQNWPTTGAWPNFNNWPPLALPPLASYFGPVAGRSCMAHTNITSAATPYAVRVFDYARENISAPAVVWPNFAGDVLTGGIMSLNWACIEYPVGNFTRITFASGSSTGSASAVTPLLQSDTVTLATPIPIGAKFFVWFSWQNSVGLQFTVNSTGLTQYLPGGDAIRQSATDYSMGQNGPFVDQGIGVGMWPAAILGNTTRRTYAVLGDSRNCTGAGIADAKGEQGQLGRSLGQTYGHVNTSMAGETGASYLAAHTNRILVANFASDIIWAYDINDVTAGLSAASINATDASVAALFPTKNFVYCTMPPRTGSTDNWATTGNQIPPGGGYVDATRVAVNTVHRSKPRVLDIAAVLEAGLNNGLWRVNGLPFAYTGDGTHETLAGDDLLLPALALPP